MLQKLKSILFGTRSSASRSSLTDLPPIATNIPVANPRLVEAIERFAADTGDAAQYVLWRELNQAEYLVAIDSDRADASARNEVGLSIIDKDSVISIHHTYDGDGKLYLPLFTDGEAVRRHFKRPVSTLVFYPQDAWYWALQMGEYAGIIINPGDLALTLDNERIRYLKGLDGIKQAPHQRAFVYSVRESK